jgi:hypothetical protein
MCDGTSGLTVTPQGYQGAAQHTFTPGCAGHHPPGPCPPSRATPAGQVQRGLDYIRVTYGPQQEDTS